MSNPEHAIPFNHPCVGEREIAYVMQALVSNHLEGNGPFTQQCQRLLSETLSVPSALLVTSGTHALEMTALLLNVGAGDEVILPSFTFVSTVNAFVLRGAKPVFIDVRPDTLNFDERLLEPLISAHTKAIVPVHYAGVGCEMTTILEIAQRHGIPVVEDNAHGLFGKYCGQYLGTFGALAIQSFHATKNVSCGEGGALLINDPRFTERAEILREKGTDRSRFFRGQVDKYTWVDVGSSYVLSDILAAMLLAQLEQRQQLQAARQALWQRYADGLAGWARAQGIGLPQVPAHCEQSYHMFYLLLPSAQARTAFIAHLKARRIQSVFHYLPLHTSRMGEVFGYRQGDCPVTEDISARLVRLPFYAQLSDEDFSRISEAVLSFGAIH